MESTNLQVLWDAAFILDQQEMEGEDGDVLSLVLSNSTS
jgi:hypothetical protein